MRVSTNVCSTFYVCSVFVELLRNVDQESQQKKGGGGVRQLTECECVYMYMCIYVYQLHNILCQHRKFCKCKKKYPSIYSWCNTVALFKISFQLEAKK